MAWCIFGQFISGSAWTIIWCVMFVCHLLCIIGLWGFQCKAFRHTMYILLGVSFEMWNRDLFGRNCHINRITLQANYKQWKRPDGVEILVHIYNIQFLWHFTASPSDFLLWFCVHQDVVTSFHNGQQIPSTCVANCLQSLSLAGERFNKKI